MSKPEENNSYQNWLRQLEAGLAEKKQTHTYRSLTTIVGPQGPTLRIGGSAGGEGREMLQFCTNNYLGLANDPEVVEAARGALEKYGMGAGASRLVAGSMELHEELERALAEFKGSERALVFSTGFMANMAVLTTFAGGGGKIISDKLNHASLIDAARYAGVEHRVFPHRNYERAEELARRAGRGNELNGGEQTGPNFLVTDSVFSMDGDCADLPGLVEVAERHGGLVVIDEAHGTGVLGEQGRGVAELQQVEGKIAITVGTLSKAVGSVGGFVCGAKEIIESLINGGRTFIYTTALPPVCSAASLAALKIIRSAEGKRRRERVGALGEWVRKELRGMGYDCGDSRTPIIPVMLGASERAVRASGWLAERGIWVPAIRPPTVGPNQARLRISLMATHTAEEVERLIGALKHMRDVV